MDFEHVIKVLGLLGSFAGAFTLGRRPVDIFNAYLHIELTIEELSEEYKVADRRGEQKLHCP
jgi:hypothetical protein